MEYTAAPVGDTLNAPATEPTPAASVVGTVGAGGYVGTGGGGGVPYEVLCPMKHTIHKTNVILFFEITKYVVII
jgi:hypothetical protein